MLATRLHASLLYFSVRGRFTSLVTFVAWFDAIGLQSRSRLFVDASRPSHGQRRQVPSAKPRCVVCPGDVPQFSGDADIDASGWVDRSSDHVAVVSNESMWRNASQLLQISSSSALGFVQHPHNWAKFGRLAAPNEPQGCNISEDCLTNDLEVLLPACITQSKEFAYDCVGGKCSKQADEGTPCFSQACGDNLVCTPSMAKRDDEVSVVSFRCSKKNEGTSIGEKCASECAPVLATHSRAGNGTAPRIVSVDELKNMGVMNETFCSHHDTPQVLDAECFQHEVGKDMLCGFRRSEECGLNAKGDSFCESGTACEADASGKYRCQRSCKEDKDCPSIELGVHSLDDDDTCHSVSKELESKCSGKVCKSDVVKEGDPCHPKEAPCGGGLACLPTPTRDPGGRYVEVRHRCRQKLDLDEEGFMQSKSGQCSPLFAYSVVPDSEPRLYVHSLHPDFENLCKEGKKVTKLFHVMELREQGGRCVFNKSEPCGRNLGTGVDDLCEPGTQCLFSVSAAGWRCLSEEEAAKEEDGANATETPAGKAKAAESAARAVVVPAKLMAAFLIVGAALRAEATSSW